MVPGTYTAKDLMALVKKGGGEATLKTAQGEPLTVDKARGGKGLTVTDSKGNTARVTIANVMQSNGVIHVHRRRADALIATRGLRSTPEPVPHSRTSLPE